jgi:L-Ala-D/L-Glu epimerase
MIRSQAVRKRLVPRHVFRIARGAKPLVENVFLALEQKGVIGYGEASPNAFYHEGADDVHMRLLGLADWLRRQTVAEPEDIAAITEAAWPLLSPSRAAQCALDLALWDLLAKMRDVTVAELALGQPAEPVVSSATVSLALGATESEDQAKLLQEARGFTRLKIKVGATVNWDALGHLRESQALASTGLPQVMPAIKRQWALDANASWTPDSLSGKLAALQRFAPYLLEQPVSPENDAALKGIEFPCPVYADESCRSENDITRLAGIYQGINIKLVKCGGLSPALRMRAKAKELGLKVMVGCMLESSLLIAAGLVAAQGCDWADLDGAWLLGHDPFLGLAWDGGVLKPSTLPGFGVAPFDYFPDRAAKIALTTGGGT